MECGVVDDPGFDNKTPLFYKQTLPRTNLTQNILYTPYLLLTPTHASA